MVFAAMIEGDAAVLMWVGFFAFCALILGWMFYMMTCRTDDWLRLVEADKQWRKAEEERKAKQAERHGKIVRGTLGVGLKIAEKVLKKK